MKYATSFAVLLCLCLRHDVADEQGVPANNGPVLSPLTVVITGDGRVSPNLTNRLLRVGIAYTITAIPRTGSIFSHWSGVGGSINPRLRFVMDSNLVLHAHFVPNPFIALKGRYAGLIFETGPSVLTNSGLLMATLTDHGRLSAKLQFVGKTYSLSGQFTAWGAFSNAISRRGLTPLFMQLQLDFAGTERMTGWITDGLFAATALANRATFSRTRNPAPTGGKRYTLVMGPNDDSLLVPGGTGFGTVTVDLSGNVVFAGTLPEGTKCTQSTFVSKEGVWPLFASFAYRRGGVLGWMRFTNETLSDFRGRLSWLRIAQPRAQLYPAGFKLSKGLEAVGSLYTYSRGTPLLDLAASGVVVLEQGNLLESLTNAFTLSTNNRVAGTNRLSLTLSTSSGRFSGKVTEPASGRRITIQGVLLQKQNAGFGYFTDTNQTGPVYLGPDSDAAPSPPTVTVAADERAAEGLVPGTFTIQRTGSTSSRLTVSYSLAGAAANGVDYEALSGVVTIPPASDSTTVTVNPIDDASVEGDESVMLTIASDVGYAVGAQDSATVVITDSEPPIVSVVASNPNASEGGPNPGTFTISRSGNTAAPLTVTYTVGGTGANGTDYATLPGSLTIPSASASATLSIEPIDDADFEGDESVVLTIAPGATYTLGSQTSADVVISDNDFPVVTVVAANSGTTEGGSNSGTFTITRTGITAPALTVSYTLAGTASNGTDYATLSGSVTIPSASASATVAIAPIDDADFEGDESVVLALASGPAYVIGSSSNATVRIGDNDAPTTVRNLPSSVLNLTNWKLTLPVDTPRDGSPDEVRQPELAGFADTNYFRVNDARDGVVFVAHCGGATTVGSTYPRSELREMVGLGTGNASWATIFGTHTMEITQAITHLPDVKPHVVAGQIHDANDDVIVFRLEGTKLFIDQHGTNGPVLTTNYRLGDVFTARFSARNGGIECYYNGQYIYTYSVSALGCYFKAGCYTQSNTNRGDVATAYGEVVIYGLSVTHGP